MSSTTTATTTRNPFELALGFGAIAAIVIGIIVSGVARAAYDKAAYITELGNTLQGAFQSAPDTGALLWVTLGGQLAQLGVLVLVGMLFYFAAKWNTDHRPARQ